jgi:hypothetical protein
MKKFLALLVSFLSSMIMFIHRGGGDLALKTGAHERSVQRTCPKTILLLTNPMKKDYHII